MADPITTKDIDVMLGDKAIYETPVQEETDELHRAHADAEIANFVEKSRGLAAGGDGEDVETVDIDAILNPKQQAAEPRSKPFLNRVFDFGFGAAKVTGDVATQGLAGVDDAVRNTANLIPFVDTATQWLDRTFGDGEYDPGIEEAKTLPGAISREVSKFLTGYIPILSRVKKAGLFTQSAKGGKLKQELLAGALSEFVVRAPDEKRFSDMLIEAGIPKNILTEWLKSDPDDSAVEARFKNAVEGSLGAVLGEGVMKIAKMTKRINLWKKNNPEAMDQIAADIKFTQEEGKIIEQTVKRYGTPNGELVQKIAAGQKSRARTAAGKKTTARAATKGIEAQDVVDSKALKLGDGKIYVNYSAMSKPEDVQKAIAFVTEETEQLVNVKKRSMSQAQQKKWAESLGMTSQELLNRPDGKVWNPAEVMAARALWENAAENLVLAAEKATSPKATTADQYIYRKLLSTFGAINAEVRGASAEASRAFRAWGLGVGDLGDKARRVSDLLDEFGGAKATRFQAERVLELAKQGKLTTTRGGVEFLTRSGLAKGLDGVREAWVAGMLWMPSTHIVNGTSSIMVLMHQLANRKVASKLTDSVHADESAFAMHGMISSLKDAWRYAGMAWKSGDSGYWAGKAETARAPQFTAENFGFNSDSMWGKSVDALGTFFRTPLRVLGATDEFSKTLAYRGELHALALRDAASRGLEGDELAKAIAKTLDNPPKNLKVKAQDAATYATFQDKGGSFTQFLSRVRNDPSNNAVFRFGLTMILPFVKTPARILNYSFEHSPFALMKPAFWAEINSGDPARRAVAMSKLATGSSMMAIAFDWADSGVITGAAPTDPVEREAWLGNDKGKQPYSIKVGNTWYSFNRMDPLGMLFGFAADMAGMAHRYELGDKDMDEFGELTAGTILAMANVLINKNYMQGFARTLNAVTDPERYGKWWLGSNIATFIPFNTLMGQAARLTDEGQVRVINTVGDHLRSRIAGLNQRLVPLRDVWGRNVNRSSGLGSFYDFISPMAARSAKTDPVNDEILRLMQDPLRGDATAPRRVTKNTTFLGVQTDLSEWPDVYDAYTRMIGENVEMTDKPLLDTMNEMVQGKGFYGDMYKSLEGPYQKLTMISGLVEMQRQKAQFEIYEDEQFAAFREWIDQMRDNTGKIQMGDPEAQADIPVPVLQ